MRGARCEWERGKRGRRAGEQAGGSKLGTRRSARQGDARSIGDTRRPRLRKHAADGEPDARRGAGARGWRIGVRSYAGGPEFHAGSPLRPTHPCFVPRAADLPCRSADPLSVALQPRLLWTHRQAPQQLHSFHHPTEQLPLVPLASSRSAGPGRLRAWFRRCTTPVAAGDLGQVPPVACPSRAR
jgi:hypothetical protein